MKYILMTFFLISTQSFAFDGLLCKSDSCEISYRDQVLNGEVKKSCLKSFFTTQASDENTFEVQTLDMSNRKGTLSMVSVADHLKSAGKTPVESMEIRGLTSVFKATRYSDNTYKSSMLWNTFNTEVNMGHCRKKHFWE